ncbi:MAG: tetratricopeptide repeat protein [Candidatus Hermodarchaeota archaeon]
MTEHLYSSIYEPYELDLRKLLINGEKLTFLAGAGISIDSPSCLSSARQMMDAIIRFGAAKAAIEEILKIKNLRYEHVVQEFRDQYDRELKLMNYFEESAQPNRNHQFLAQMIKTGHYVMTTNFDYLIERAIGLENDALKVIITRKDFEECGNPQENKENGLLALYKVHGSMKNLKTGEDTSESIITTLDALGKHKDGEIFGFETFKRDFFEQVCQDRTLIVMGYSGGDDFDIIPSLLQMKGLRRLIWISHSNQADQIVKVYRDIIHPDLNFSELATLSEDDKILHTLAVSGTVEVIKIIAHTTKLIAELMKTPFEKPDTKIKHDIYEWLMENFPRPDKGKVEYFTARLFYTCGLYTDSLRFFQKAYEIYKQLENSKEMARQLGNIGLIYRHRGESRNALDYFRKAYEIYKTFKDLKGMARQESNIGILYMQTGDPHKALDYFQYSYENSQKSKNPQGIADALGNIGIIYREVGELEKALEYFQQAINIHEQLGNLRGMAKDMNNIGSLLEIQGRMDETLGYFQKAYEINKRLGDVLGMADDLNNIGFVYSKLGEYEKAIDSYHQSSKFYEAIGEFYGMTTALTNLGLINRHIGEFKRALKLFERVCSIYDGLKDIGGMSRSLEALAYVYMDKGEPEEALKHLNKAIAFYEQLGDLLGIAKQQNNFGHVYMATKKLNKALECFQEALRLYQMLGHLEEIAHQQNNIAQVYAHMGELKNALGYFKDSYGSFKQLGLQKEMEEISQAIERTTKHMQKLES